MVKFQLAFKSWDQDLMMQCNIGYKMTNNGKCVSRVHISNSAY
jgi:hypothetical protein